MAWGLLLACAARGWTVDYTALRAAADDVAKAVPHTADDCRTASADRLQQAARRLNQEAADLVFAPDVQTADAACASVKRRPWAASWSMFGVFTFVAP